MTDPVPHKTPDHWDRIAASSLFTVVIVFFALAVIGLVGGGYCTLKSQAAAPANVDGENPAVEELDPITGKPVTPEFAAPNRTDWVAGAAFGAGVMLVGFGVGAYSIGRVPADPSNPGPGPRRAIALGTGVLGGLFVLFGFVFFALWFSLLAEWLGGKPVKDAWKVVGAMLIFLGGCSFLYVASVVLKPDERNHQGYRRAAYGLNAFVLGAVVLVGLIAVNVLVAIKVPGKLDTTSTGFYTLQPETADYLKNLSTDAIVYSTITDDVLSPRVVDDVKRLLEQSQAVNPARLQVKQLSWLTGKSDIIKLKEEHPEFNRDEPGLLLVATGKPGKFLPYTDLYEAPRGGAAGQYKFLGEPKLVSLLLAATEDSDNAVYVLQGHGELEVGEKGELGARRSGSRLAQELEKTGAVVKPLLFEAAAKVPDDAAVVVVADPTAKLADDHLAALSAYMKKDRPNGKKGKLVVLAGPHNLPGGAPGLVDAGLNPLLSGFGITLGQTVLYSQPISIGTVRVEPEMAVVGMNAVQKLASNPIVQQFGQQPMVFKDCMPVTAAAQSSAVYFMATESNRLSWIEPAKSTDPIATLKAMNDENEEKRTALRRQYNLMRNARGLAAISLDGDTGRVAVFGSGEAFADARDRNAEGFATANREMLAATVNWLRDRPTAANIVGREVAEYRPNKQMSITTALFVPLFGTVAGVIALGLGVWMARRK